MIDGKIPTRVGDFETELIRKMKNRFFVIFMMFAILLTFCLGSWQVARHYEKLEKNAKLVKSFDHPKPLPQDLSSWMDVYGMYQVEGVFDFSKQIAVGPRSFNKQIGRFIYTIFYTVDKRSLLINRGFVREDKVNKINTVGVSDLQNINIMLIANKGKKWFLPKNNPEQGSWVYVDMSDIGDFFGEELSDFYFNLASEVGFFDGVESSKSKDDYKLFNPHYKYAVFWFSMLLTFLIMILTFYKKKDAQKRKNS